MNTTKNLIGAPWSFARPSASPRRSLRARLIGLVVLAAIGCGGEAATGPKAKDALGNTIKTGSGAAVSAAAANKFKAALDALSAHDKANDWNDANCASTAKMFLDASGEQGGSFNEATYNAGLAYERCKKTSEAKNYFQQTLSKDSKFHRARMKLALYKFAESNERDHDGAIGELRQAAITDAQFKNVEALVHLGMIYMKRGNNVGDNDGPNDLGRAKKYAQSALAVDDGYMPAFNLLALIYLESAKQKAGRGGHRMATNIGRQKKVDTQALELAALVCSQAIRKNSSYAAVHNTAGMINVELGNLNSAVGSFNTARKLDPSFYEAQMNFAAVNLQFRGFAQAEEAYRAAVKMRPNDYDARLGLALALRGQVNDSNFDKMVAASAAELEAAKKIAPDRPETYYNEAILTQEFKAKSGGKEAEKPLNDAKVLFSQFVSKAGAAPEFADSVKRAKERMGEIDQIITFNKQTEAERKAADADAKTKAAEAEARGEGDDTGGAPPPEDKKP